MPPKSHDTANDAAASLSPRVLFEDTHLVVVSKPPGLLSQGEKSGETNLVDWCRGHFGRNYVGLVHRLDRYTSGLMVVAKRSKSAERLTRALQDGELVRIYRALLEGELRAEAEWRHWLKKDPATNTSSVARAGAASAKEAVLRVRPITTFAQPGGRILTLAEFRLDTGRSHQIRVQSGAMGLPLLGDEKYGARYAELGLNRPALHSARMEFPHPMTKEPMSFDDSWPADLAKFLPREAHPG